MRLRDHNGVMVFNGEIYNYPELRRRCEAAGCQFQSSMDGEVILHLWHLHGPDCLAMLNGIFALAIADDDSGDVILARDPIGVKPLFYGLGTDALYFASEISALRSLGVDDGGLDPVGCGQFLTFLWIPDPMTPFRRIRSVPPGSILRWSRGATTLKSYGDPLEPSREALRISAQQAIDDGSSLLRAAIQRQLMADVPVALMASGGLDSSLIWWGANDDLARVYTIGWHSAAAEGVADDTRAVQRCEQRFGTPVTYIRGGDWDRDRRPRAGDLVADPAFDLTRAIAATTSGDGYKVLLSGHGGDELFGGYRRHHVARALFALPNLPLSDNLTRRLPVAALSFEYASRLAAAMTERDPFRRYMQLCSYSVPRERAAALGSMEWEVSDDVVWQSHSDVYSRLPAHLSALRKAMTLDLRLYLPALGLCYADRAGMEEGVEIRVPFLDLEFVRWTLSLPDRLLSRGRTKRWLQKQMASQVLPRQIVNRPKRGFSVPTTHLHAPSAGVRGFRQGSYFGYATQMLRAYREAVA